MPIILNTPEPKPATVAHEIVNFSVDLQQMTVSMQFVAIDAAGGSVPSLGIQCGLLKVDGSPRFTPAEYASIKAALYRLAIEDGHIAGTVA